MFNIQTRSEYAQLARMPRGVVIVLAAIASWLILALLWMAGSALFQLLLSQF